MRVCHLIDANLDTAYFRSIAQCHDREQYPVGIGSIHPAGGLQAAMGRVGVPTFSLGVAGRRGYGTALGRLVGLLRKERVALLHAHCFDPTLLGLLAARLARVPFVFTRHHSDHNLRLGKPWHVRIDGFCARHADHVIAVSEATRRIMTDVERVPDSRITVVYNGMEPLRRPDPEAVARLRAELGPPAGPVLLMVARLHEEKGHRYLFQALPNIQEAVGPVTVLLAGAGEEQAALEAEARRWGIAERVRFLGRRLDIPELMALASVVVMPSLAESFGFVALEAMSLGRPVVASSTGGLPEVVGEGGLVVPQADAAALGEAVVRVLRDPALARRLGRAGETRAAEFTFTRMIRGYEAVYGRVLSGTAARESVHGRPAASGPAGTGSSG